MAEQTDGQIETVMRETRLFPPPAQFAARARIKSLAEYQELWDRAAADRPKFGGFACIRPSEDYDNAQLFGRLARIRSELQKQTTQIALQQFPHRGVH